MRKTVVMVAVVLTLSVLNVSAQDGKATLDAAAQAMGSNAVASIEFTGSGMNAAYGQAYAPGGPWPAFKVTRYKATVGYATKAMQVEFERTNPDGRVQGGGGLPLVAPQKQVQVVSGNAAWNVAGTAAAPAFATARDRQVAIWTTPQGVIKGAQLNNATVNGRVISYKVAGVDLKATLAADNTVASVETVADAPVLGDVVTETTYSGYRSFGTLKFPTRIVQKQGGQPILDLTISDAKPNPVVLIQVPRNVAQAAANPTAAPVTVTTTKVADGVYYLTGGSHHSVAVEFRDYALVIEAPQTDERAMAVLDATRKAIPNKPIRYVVNSHNHFDHLGGIRAVMAEGITVITQEKNKPYYEQIARTSHTINPDRLAMSPKPAVIETVADKRVITDGNQTVELLRLPSMHSETLLTAYLPKPKLLFEVDVWNPPAQPPAAGAPLNPATVEFVDTLDRMGLSVDQVLTGHGPAPQTLQALRAAAGKTGAAPVQAAAAAGAPRAAQARPAQSVPEAIRPIPPQTFTGCLKPAATIGYMLADASIAGSSTKQNYNLVGVAPPAFRLSALVNQRLEVTGTVAEPLAAGQPPRLTMSDMKRGSGSCSDQAGAPAAAPRAAAARPAQGTPAAIRPVPPQTFTGCLKPGATVGYMLVDASAAGSSTKQNFNLTGVAPPAFRLDRLVDTRLEVTGTIADPLGPGQPSRLTMSDMKRASGSCM